MNPNETPTTTTTDVAKTEKVTLKSLLQKQTISKRFEEVLGKRAPQFIASIIIAGTRLGPDCDPMSIIGAAMTAAALDLPIDPNLGFAHIVPYKEGRGGIKFAQFQIGYKGYIQLALRTGQYSGMNAVEINAEVLTGYDIIGDPIIDWSKLDHSKEIFGYVFAYRTVGGFAKVAMWTKERIEAHAKRYSKAYSSDKSPWKSNFDGMALKTVIANTLRRWGIMSVEMTNNPLMLDQTIRRTIDSAPEFIDATADPEVVTPKIDTTEAKEELFGPGEGDDHPPMTKLEELRSLMARDGVLELMLISYLHETKLADETLRNLQEVEIASPSIIEGLVAGWVDAAKRVKAARKGGGK